MAFNINFYELNIIKINIVETNGGNIKFENIGSSDWF